MKIKFKKKNIELKARELSKIGMARGLMFRRRNCENLLFDFENEGNWAIHSWFVFFPFLAIWLDSRNNVVEHKIVKPFCFSVKPRRHFQRLIEVPLNRENADVISQFLDGERFIY